MKRTIATITLIAATATSAFAGNAWENASVGVREAVSMNVLTKAFQRRPAQRELITFIDCMNQSIGKPKANLQALATVCGARAQLGH